MFKHVISRVTYVTHDILPSSTIFKMESPNTSPNTGDESVLLDLPNELIAHIVSFLTARDKAQLQITSRRLRSVSETPSLWREFVWPYYHTGDEGCANNVLKVYGQHVKRLSFPNRISLPSRLLRFLGYCSNAVELSLPTTVLNPEQLGKCIHLQKLDIQWDGKIKQLLEVVGGTGNLKELIVRVTGSLQSQYSNIDSFIRIGSWMNYWTSHGYVPQKLIIITELASPYVDRFKDSWKKLNAAPLNGETGHLELYTRLNYPLNLFTILPEFQVDFGKGATLPYVRSSSVGLQGLGKDVILSGSTCADKLVHKAVLVSRCFEDYHNHGINNLESVIDFDVSCCDTMELTQLAIACPNLQRLNLKKNLQCLRDLQGLRAISISCCNLQGLNLLGIPVTVVEDQTQLWEILSDMKLTHLAVELCVLLPSTTNKQFLIRSFQKCVCLQALESRLLCSECKLRFVDDIVSVLAHFPSLIHCVLTVHDHHYTKGVQEVLNSCKKLKYLQYTENHSVPLLSLTHNLCLQQLYITSHISEIPDAFLQAVSVHGGLVHVVLNVWSVSSDGLAVLIHNSPDLVTFHIVVDSALHDCKGTMVSMEQVETKLKRKFPLRRLFKSGSYIVARALTKLCDYMEVERQCNTDLCSLWT